MAGLRLWSARELVVIYHQTTHSDSHFPGPAPPLIFPRRKVGENLTRARPRAAGLVISCDRRESSTAWSTLIAPDSLASMHGEDLYAINNQRKAQNVPHVGCILHALGWFFIDEDSWRSKTLDLILGIDWTSLISNNIYHWTALALSLSQTLRNINRKIFYGNI